MTTKVAYLNASPDFMAEAIKVLERNVERLEKEKLIWLEEKAKLEMDIRRRDYVIANLRQHRAT